MRIARLLLPVLALLAPAALAAAEDELWNLLNEGGQVVLMRHGAAEQGLAFESGVRGAAPHHGLRLHDCSTQSNLTDEGREHARRIGEAFRLHRIPIEHVLASPWCRTIETAGIAFGHAEIEPALGNLYGRAWKRPQRVRELRALVSEPRESGNLVLVSHSATILALTGIAPTPGEIVVITPLGGGRFAVAGRLDVL